MKNIISKFKFKRSTAIPITIILIVLSFTVVNMAHAATGTTIEFANGGTATLNSDGSITGTARTGVNAVYRGGTTWGNITSGSATMPNGDEVTTYCYESYINQPDHAKKPFPGTGLASFKATPNSDGGYTVILYTAEFSTRAYFTNLGSYSSSAWHPCQNLITFNWNPQINGNVKLKSESANPSITEGNGCYSLEGAEFTIYNASGESMGTLKTDKDGVTGTLSLPAGTYTVKETIAPEGFYKAADQNMTISAGETSILTFMGEPATDPVSMVVLKYDSDFGVN